MKRITVIIIAALLLICTVTAYANSPFTDLASSNWAYESVNAMREKGIIEGFPDGSFKPAKAVTYGEFIKMALIAATGNDVGNSTSGNWALNYYNKALGLHYFTGEDITPAQLNEGIPRGDMGLIIGSMIAERIEYDQTIENGGEFSFSVGDKRILYDDAAEMADNLLTDIDSKTKHQDQIIMAYLNGILTGYPDKTFRPDSTLSRAEAAAVIHRIADPAQAIAPDILKVTFTDEMIDKMLDNISTDGVLTNGEYLGVSSAAELKKEKPVTYYSYTSKDKKPISGAISNKEDIANPVFICKYYKIVSAEDIGFTSIKKTVDKFNSERIEVLPGDKSTSAILIKDGKVVCELTRASGNGTTPTLFFPGTDKYYGGNYKNNVLMDFDYIGFWTHPSDTVFLVKKPW